MNTKDTKADGREPQISRMTQIRIANRRLPIADCQMTATHSAFGNRHSESVSSVQSVVQLFFVSFVSFVDNLFHMTFTSRTSAAAATDMPTTIHRVISSDWRGTSFMSGSFIAL